jgi:predicted nuclease of predicted toxin-antitoxin system
MDLLANENFPLLSVRILREAGHRVVSIVQDAPGSRDEDILRQAHIQRLIILTFDRDYGELIYRHRALTPAGVVYFRFAPATPSEPAEILLNILSKADLSVIGKFTIVEKGRLRQRTLHADGSQPSEDKIN